MFSATSSSRITRWLFGLWLLNVAFIPLLSVFGRPLQYWVAETIGYRAAAWLIGLALFIAIVILLLYLKRLSGQLRYYHLSWFLPLFLIIPLLLERVEERLHFLSFGAFGALSLLLFAPRYAIILCLLFSSADELLQYYLPDRVGDWRDVGFNSLASLSAALFTALSIQTTDRRTNDH